MQRIITENIDPAFRYEELARYTFDNCSKFGDPWNYAAQEVYTNFSATLELKGRRILSTILVKLIWDYRDNENCQKLIDIEDSIWAATSQKDVISIINKTIDIINI